MCVCVRLNSTRYWLLGLLPWRSGQEGKGRASGGGSRTLLVAPHSPERLARSSLVPAGRSGKSRSSRPFLCRHFVALFLGPSPG